MDALTSDNRREGNGSLLVQLVCLLRSDQAIFKVEKKKQKKCVNSRL